MSKIWTINVLVDTNFLYKLSKEKGHGTGTWEHPVGKNKRFKDHVFLVGSNTKDDTIVTGNDNNFKIPVAPGDQIRWLCTPMNPMMYPNTENKMNLSVCLYGFEKKAIGLNILKIQ